MSDSICITDRVFVHALATVKRIPRTGSARPPPSDRLKLYGLYKQSTEGNVEGVSRRPEGTDPEAANERDKWDAWHAHHGLSRTEAKRRYISTLIDTMHKYATTTPEARELVSELEFVWDQIKSNSASSTDSSPGHIGRTQGRQLTNPSYASIGHDKRRGSDGLRILRPVSDGDEEDADLEDEDLQETPLGAYDDGAAVAGVPPPLPRDLDIRNRKWRKRIDRALVTLTTEVAALREQIEAKRIAEGKKRNGIWAWLVWLVWVAVRHALVNLAILGMMVVWARRKRDKDGKVDVGVRYLAEQVRQLLWPLRTPKRKR